MKRFFTFLILISFVQLLFSQTRTIKGKVTDDTGEPLLGVTIVKKSTTEGVITDFNGDYEIEVNEGDVLVFSYVGFLAETIEITNQEVLDVTLITDIQSLDEVVVIGYGTQKKSLVTGAISKVTAEDLNKNQARLEQALQGKTAGVNIIQESGAPGAGITVRIRGTGTNRNADPLYIVDGMRTGGIEYLNANDIASIEILKDAASAAIYGAEGANGVVLVTTKSGNSDHSEISYNYNYGYQVPGKLNEVLNAKQYATYYREGLRHEIQSKYEGIEIPEALLERNINSAYPFSPDTLGTGTDWLDEIFQTAPMTEHNLSFSGGNEKTSVFASGSYFSQDGIVGGSKSNFTRYTARVNVDHQAKDWLKVGANVSFTHFERTEIDENNEFGGVISNALNIDPITSVYVKDTSLFPDKYKQQIYDNIKNIETSSLRAPGDLGYYNMSKYVQNEVRNPVAQINNRHSEWYTDKVLGGMNVNVTPIPGLTLRSAVDVDLAFGTNTYWTPVYYYHSINYNYLSSTGQEIQRWFTWQWENTANYTRQIGDHNVSVLAGTTAREYKQNRLRGLGEGLLEESWNFAVIDAVLSDSTKAAAGGSRNEDNRLLSYFGRVQYDYQNKYMMTLVLRSDASSKLSSKQRTQYFPSASVGWVVSNEDFWNVPIINFVKLRAGWGQNGAIQSLGVFEYESIVETNANSSYYISGGTRLAGSEPRALSNPDLVWETSEQTNIGVDLRFLNNRLSFSADGYVKKTKDLITTAPISQYVGNNIPSANAGDIVNQGVELELKYREVRGDFDYSIGINAAYNENEITNLETTLLGQNLGTTGAITRSVEGLPIWYFYGYETDDIFDTFDEVRAYVDDEGNLIQKTAIPGDVKFVDQNDDGVINEDDKTYIGDPHPDWIFGFNTSVSYKFIDLSVFFNGTYGNEIYFGAYRTDLNNNNKPLFFLEDAWTPENHTDDFPRYTVNDNNNNFSHNDLFVFDGSYLRLQNLEIGFTLPSNIAEKMKISRLRIYASGKNLMLLTKYPGGDPEIGDSSGPNDKRDKKSIGIDRGLFPRSQVYSFGINLTL